MAPIVLVVFVLILPWLFRGSFTADPEHAAEVMELNEREAIQDGRLLVKCAVVLVAVFAAFVGHSVLHIEQSVVALLGAGVLVLISRSEPRPSA
jgi:Na+/H+ antiporter NhaD/arsenite permease-like protein